MKELTDENFEKEIKNAGKPVLVDFWMQDCAPCFMLLPILEKLANEYGEKIIFAKANLDTAPQISQEYGINLTPTVILFKGGRPVSGFIGFKPEPKIRKWLEENLKVEEAKPSSPPSLSLRESSVNDSGKIEKLIKEYQEYAEKNNFRLNPNKVAVERIIKGLLENKKKYGVRYCPCRRVREDLEENKKIICPCFYHRQEIEKDGHCLCGLFVR